MYSGKEEQEYYKPEPIEEDDYELEWKKEEEKWARLKYRNSLISRLVETPKSNLIKRFKQKIR